MPTRISAPAAARDFAIDQPYPLSSATPAIKALLPMHNVASVEKYLFLYSEYYESGITMNLCKSKIPGKENFNGMAHMCK